LNLKISELFYSIQGEGKRTGFPSYFIRTNYCNLRCKFEGGNLCDTAYTSWNPEDENNIGDVKISYITKRYKRYNCRDIVITGGEPTMFPDDLKELCAELKNIRLDSFITLETNGTLFSSFIEYIDLVSISPKLKSSIPRKTEFEKMHSKNRINLKTLRDYHTNSKIFNYDIQWKFVFTMEKDIEEIFELQEKIGFSREDIYLMPEAVTKKELDGRRPFIIEFCKKYKLNYTDRLQVSLWNNARGV